MDALLPLRVDQTVAFVVDVQEKLLPAIEGGAALLGQVAKLVEAMTVLGVPLVATEQYPAGLGRTCPAVAEKWGEVDVVEKTRFSGCVEPVLEQLGAWKRRQVLVAGMEAHVCVQQTVLDLLRQGYVPYVLADAVGSRRGLDQEMALVRMRQAGAIVTTVESVIFELLGEAGGERFKRVLKIVK